MPGIGKIELVSYAGSTAAGTDGVILNVAREATCCSARCASHTRFPEARRSTIRAKNRWVWTLARGYHLPSQPKGRSQKLSGPRTLEPQVRVVANQRDRRGLQRAQALASNSDWSKPHGNSREVSALFPKIPATARSTRRNVRAPVAHRRLRPGGNPCGIDELGQHDAHATDAPEPQTNPVKPKRTSAIQASPDAATTSASKPTSPRAPTIPMPTRARGQGAARSCPGSTPPQSAAGSEPCQPLSSSSAANRRPHRRPLPTSENNEKETSRERLRHPALRELSIPRRSLAATSPAAGHAASSQGGHGLLCEGRGWSPLGQRDRFVVQVDGAGLWLQQYATWNEAYRSITYC